MKKLVFLLLLCLFANPVLSIFQTETVTTTSTYGASGLALDSKGYPHIINYLSNKLVYLKWDGSAWINVKEFSSYTRMGSMALDSNDNLHLFYQTPSPSYNLTYAKGNGTDWGTNVFGSWNDSIGTGPFPFDTIPKSLTVDVNNNPHFVFINITNRTIISSSYWYNSSTIYAKGNGTGWIFREIDKGFSTGVPRFPTITIDKNNNTHITYVNHTPTRQYIVYVKLNETDIIQQQEVPMTVPFTDGITSFILLTDSNTNPYIVAIRSNQYAKWNGTKWTISSTKFTFFGAALDPNDNFHAITSYMIAGGTFVSHYKLDGDGWKNTFIDGGEYSSTVYYPVPIVFDQSGNLHVAYPFGYPTTYLKYAKINYTTCGEEIKDCICGDVLVTNYTLSSNLSCSSKGLEIYANNITLDCGGYSIIGNRVGDGILVSKDNITIKNCNVENFTRGIQLSGENIKILNSTFQNNSYINPQYSFASYYHDITAIDSSNNNLSSNTMKDQAYLYLSDNSVIENNNFTYFSTSPQGYGSFALVLFGLNSLISNNSFGSMLSSGFNNTIANNFATGPASGSHGAITIEGTNSIVENNTITNPNPERDYNKASSGIKVRGSGHKIANNLIYDTSWGISWGSVPTPSTLTIVNNTISNTIRAISLSSYPSMTIENNTINNSGGVLVDPAWPQYPYTYKYAIWVMGSNQRVVGNNIINVWSGISAGGDAVVTDNYVLNSSDIGISVSATTTNPVITIANNTLIDINSTAISISGGQNVSVRENSVENAMTGISVGGGVRSISCAANRCLPPYEASKNLTLSNNIFRNISTGINVGNFLDAIVENNSITGNPMMAGYGIYITSNVDGSTMRNNTIRNFNGSAILVIRSYG